MSPAPNGKSEIHVQCFERSDAIEMRNGIIFDFYMGLPHLNLAPLLHVHTVCICSFATRKRLVCVRVCTNSFQIVWHWSVPQCTSHSHSFVQHYSLTHPSSYTHTHPPQVSVTQGCPSIQPHTITGDYLLHINVSYDEPPLNIEGTNLEVFETEFNNNEFMCEVCTGEGTSQSCRRVPAQLSAGQNQVHCMIEQNQVRASNK